MTSEDFIAYLERQRSISPGVARQLRAKAAQGDNRINPKSILKYLVKKEIVSREAAKEILQTRLTVSDQAESSILGDAAIARRSERTSKPAEAREAFSASSAASPPPRAAVSGSDLLDDDVLPLKPLNASISGAAHEEIVETFPLGEEDAAPLSTRKPGKKKKKKKGRRDAKEKGQSEWDSPLVLMGGAGLALLVIAGVVLYYLLTRENADLVLKDANQQFEGGSYTQAINRYEYFIQNWPGHEDISQARVRLGVARVRRETEAGSNFAQALATAQEVIKNIQDEPAFTSDGGDDRGLSEGKRDLSELLTKIAEGLAQQADAATDPEVVKQRVEQINAVLALTANTKYVPELLRQGDRLNAVRETLDRVQQRLARDADLAAALAAMDQAIAAGDAAGAFKTRSAVIDKYPVLIDDKSLAEKVLKIAAAEQSLVKFVAAEQAAQTEAAATPVIAEIALAERRGAAGGAAAGAAGSSPQVVKVDGALYALDAADGSLLWRRFVGFDDASQPLVLAEGRVVAASPIQRELVCLSLDQGKLLWRQALEGKLATPVLAGQRLLVASDAGKLFVLEASTGQLAGHVQFTQPLRQPPAVNEAGDRAYVVGEHSNLYTLALRDLACLGVYYVGHSAGSVAAPPLTVLNKVVVADNSGAETCQLRMLSLNDQGAAVREVASHRLAGLVVTPLQKAGRRLASVTTRGQAIVFEAGGADDASALTAIATREPQDREQIARYSLLHEGALWVAGRQLLKLGVLPTDNQLPVRSLDRDYRGDAFDYPLQAVGSELLHVRRPQGRGGAIVGAMDAASNRVLWETELAVPPAGAAAADASAMLITAGASSGAVFKVDREAMTRRVQDDAVRADTPTGQPLLLTESLDLAQGRLALGGVGVARMLLFRPAEGPAALTPIDLPGPLSCPPIAWGEGFVAATDVGQVFLYDAASGGPRGAPFQPEIIPGKTYRWLRPALAGSGASAQLAISDGRSKIYIVAMNDQPQPHLAAVATGDVGPSPLTTPLAVAGRRVFAGNEAGALASFALADLTPGEPLPLGGRVTWGPHACGDGLLLATDGGELMMAGPDGAIRWRQKLAHGELAGEPLTEDDSALVLYGSGGLARIRLADGAEAAFVVLDQPAIRGPVPFGPRLILTAPDGALLVVNRP
ncbi:MAG: PQQ-like beta-propeller repeat protein [Pirellulales bacterium]|nr:PQQ-like beta-propeller repeat protein [Pirellulales bacterium]